MEDEVHWSDSSINSPILRAADTHGIPMSFKAPELSVNALSHAGEPRLPHGDHSYPNAGQDVMELPVGQPFNPYLNGSAHLKPIVSRSQRSRIGVHSNRRKPSRDDYSNFVLYQASQRVYEATFVKNFVTHALHPDRFEVCFSSQDPQESVRIRQYLRSIADNVNKLATKMIWNTHSRTVNLMANDENETTPFWDFQQFENQPFANFSPGNVFPVVGLMNQSWHRAFSHPSMVRYSAAQYQVGPDASPFEEIDDVTGHTKLFEARSNAHTASRDRVVRAPRTKMPKNCHLPGAILRENPTPPCNNWLQGMMQYGGGSGSGFMFPESSKVPIALYNTSQDVLLPDATPARDAVAFDTQSVSSSSCDNIGDFFSARRNIMRKSDGIKATSVRITQLRANQPTCPKNLVALHGPDALLKKSNVYPLSEDTPRDSGKRPSWKKALIENHKNRLTERRPRSQRRPDAAMEFKSCLDRAIKNGDLKFLGSGLQKMANFVNPHNVVPPTNRVKPGFNKISVLQAEPVMQQNIDAGDSTVKSTHSTQRNSQAIFRRPNKRQKRAPKAVVIKSSKNLESSKFSKYSGNPEATLHSVGANSSSSSILAQANPNHGTSRTLEHHQQLPPGAYFEKIADDEQPVWRCGIKHPMGYYYNAGDRKNCPGCFTASSEKFNPKRKLMDFYLPTRSHFFQPAPGVTWIPGKPTGKPRRSGNLSHNSIAKDAYWEAISAGATTGEAVEKGIKAVEAFLRAKLEKKAKKEPTPEPTPKPVFLRPHPSGSKTMEHSQDLPFGAYWKKQGRYDEFSWRCDVNHALGRYYLASDVKSCPGCGSCSSGPGQHPQMDFYLPSGSIARQEAPGLVKYKPRKAYKLTKKSKKAKQIVTHNQFCSRKYWELVEEGHGHVEGGVNEEALALAIKATDAYVDAKVAEMQARLEESRSSDEEQPETKSKGKRKRGGKQPKPLFEDDSPLRRGRVDACVFSSASSTPLIPRKRNIDRVTEYEPAKDDEEVQQEIILLSSNESTSDSDT
ncbi:hypothetical protein PMIN04_004933 [Paraphaeosphaeria minitans]|uniref:Uncharacterized protein n=1 Tax=Paraphaeosphaeria minitans TaxID=565426 RepID=A0A9P6KVS8_9PLEO|nr:hypothetical protein PMIN01_02986 [Paraphaeosphaeria minitans]